MSDAARKLPPHEQFGYDVLERAVEGESLSQWENDYARLFWQSLEVHNGGFAQWIGNTGVDGVWETLEVLDRHAFLESYRVTRSACELLKLDCWAGEQSFCEYLDATVANWFDHLRPLDEAYWDDGDNFDEKLKAIYHTEVGSNALDEGLDRF